MEETLQLYELQYSDLTALLSDQNNASVEEHNRLKSVSKTIMENLGPNGPGLISIAGVPKAQTLRKALLPMARKLSLLSSDDRKTTLKDHNLGSDVPLKNPGRVVSSFAMQMRYDQEFGRRVEGDEMDRGVDGGEFKGLGFMCRELGFCMMELGLCFARVCGKLIGGSELEQSLLQCGSAKGRLIHYHSVADNVASKEAVKGRQNGRGGKANLEEDCRLGDGDGGGLKLWQQWHYDYGIFTILTSPMFMLSNGSEDERECESPSGHTYLQVFHPGLKCVKMVRASKGSFIVQVGESADVLSKGKLRATLHSVSRPVKIDDLSRETFVVFLQPAWSKILTFSDEDLRLREDEDLKSCNEEMNGSSRDIHGIVPPLSSRLRNGMTFAEFSRETTKQYYGGGGLQSNK